ncbi:YjgP/YjgQ family permease [Flavihumibacter sp. R14]|nr:YjgP/YjgQ family permease [Flavihumibacter soli]
MKKVYLLVLKAFFRPFIVTFFIVMFILLMLFLFKYIDDLIGKGFEWYVILELLLYSSATNVAMALPLAILLSSIMTFGSLGENYELVALKSAGISLQRAMMPLVVVIGMISVAAFFFSDYMLPVANLKYGSLIYDVRNQKASFLIDEGIFNNSITGYSIRVKKKGDDGQTLHDIVIYDHTSNSGNASILVAKEGRMYRTEDDQTLVLKLKDGRRYEESQGDATTYNPREQLTRTKFKETEQKFDLSGFKLQRTDENLFKSNFAMLNLRQLGVYRDSFKVKIDSNRKTVYSNIRGYYNPPPVVNTNKTNIKSLPPLKPYNDVLEMFAPYNRMSAIQNARSQINSLKEVLNQKEAFNSEADSRVRGFLVEYYKKYTLSASCLLLFFIGAPLGAIIRRGGLGLPVVMSVLFFLLYHIVSTVGEKSVKEGTVDPMLGMWMSIIAFTPLGIFLTYKATVDSVLFDADFYKMWLKKLFPARFKYGEEA